MSEHTNTDSAQAEAGGGYDVTEIQERWLPVWD